MTLGLTGERTLPGIPAENYWFRRHEAAYRQLAGQVRGGRLLEIGAGEGYGAALLAERAQLACALDYDLAAVRHLAGRYPGLNPVQANLAALPVGTNQVDVVVSLQVIEHVWDHRQFLQECARVLRPDGQLVLSTPNRLTFSPGSGAHDRPRNPFHSHEFTADELPPLLASAGFDPVRLTGLRAGPRLIALDERYRLAGGLVAAQLARPPSDWSAGLLADVSSVTVADFVIGEDELGASLDLIVQARPA